jgi:hypothetical protein
MNWCNWDFTCNQEKRSALGISGTYQLWTRFAWFQFQKGSLRDSPHCILNQPRPLLTAVFILAKVTIPIAPRLPFLLDELLHAFCNLVYIKV